jgi:rubrerythrin
MQDTQTQNGNASGTVPDSPVDDATYNILQALTSKLEAIEAYELYAEQDDQGVFTELLDDERRHAEKLYGALQERIGSR